MSRALRLLVLALACLLLVPATASASFDRAEVVSQDASLVVEAPVLEDDELPGENEPLPDGESSNKTLIIVLVLVGAALVLAAGAVVICCCCFGSYYY